MHIGQVLRGGFGVAWLIGAATALAAPVQSGFDFSVKPIGTGSADDHEALRRAISGAWQDYLRMDAAGYVARHLPDATRLSGRAPGRQRGREAIRAGLPAEWSAFERPGNRIAERMTVERAEFTVSGSSALATYWVDVEGGVRWDYSDQGLVFQAFVKRDGRWWIAHHTDTWSLDYDVEAQQPGAGDTRRFDFAYPVQDLARALRFYTPLLGEPESQTTTRAVYNVRGARFVLDSETWGGAARVRQGLPNGYAVFVAPPQAPITGTTDDAGEVGPPRRIGADAWRIGFDADENLFLIHEPTYRLDRNGAPTLQGFPGEPAARAAEAVMRAWLGMDAAALQAQQTADATWLDDTRLKHRGLERGARLAEALKTRYWPTYDHGPQGITAELQASQVEVRPLGAYTVVSYDSRLRGRGPHPFRDSAWVTQVFDAGQKLRHSFIVNNDRSSAPVLELDYTGYPTEDLPAARSFYRKGIGFGEGYPDEDYYGFWSNHAVFGLYLADPEEDGIPEARRANGYLSFWVRSARDTYAYLKQQGRAFPVIPAINDQAGPDSQPGYTQVVSTDSEGNLVIFTEYSGRPR